MPCTYARQKPTICMFYAKSPLNMRIMAHYTSKEERTASILPFSGLLGKKCQGFSIDLTSLRTMMMLERMPRAILK
jgi:hypothetical protein